MALSNSARRPPADRPTPIATRAEGTIKLAQTVVELQRSAGETEELADRVWAILDELGVTPESLPPKPPSRTPSSVPASPPSVRVPQKAKWADPIFTERAVRGAETIRFTPRDARTTLVAINGAAPVKLSPGLAVLLRILASGPRDADGFPAFRSFDDIAAEMSSITGRHAGRRAVVQGISRLRDWLGAMKGPSPKLVETAEVRLARFRLAGELIID